RSRSVRMRSLSDLFARLQVPQMECCLITTLFRFALRYCQEFAVRGNGLDTPILIAQILRAELAEFFAGMRFPHAHGLIAAPRDDLSPLGSESCYPPDTSGIAV